VLLSQTHESCNNAHRLANDRLVRRRSSRRHSRLDARALALSLCPRAETHKGPVIEIVEQLPVMG
jgi:hypothetical protein